MNINHEALIRGQVCELCMRQFASEAERNAHIGREHADYNRGFLPGLAPAEAKREKIRKRVRPTSRAQYADGRERFRGRRADVLRWLAATYNRTQIWPTSAELAIHILSNEAILSYKLTAWGEIVLYVRRGLSDLQDSGVVEAIRDGDGKLVERICAVTKRKCHVWRVKER